MYCENRSVGAISEPAGAKNILHSRTKENPAVELNSVVQLDELLVGLLRNGLRALQRSHAGIYVEFYPSDAGYLIRRRPHPLSCFF